MKGLRLLLAPLWVLAAAVAALLSPVLAAIAALAALVFRRRQPLLFVRFGVLYMLGEAAVLTACAVLWVASGFGRRLREPRFAALHYRLLGWLVGGLVRPAFATLDLDLDLEPSADAARALASDAPLLVFSRHAGPGDSAVILDLLLNRYRRLPRIVLKKQLALDPMIDLVCRRLPMALIDVEDTEGCERQIADLARSMDARSVVLLFPEGGNFTPERRRRAIRHLLRGGDGRRARRAAEMRHVVAPRPGGALAAIRAAPDLDVVFTAHTGFGTETFPSELWRRLPQGKTLSMRMWLAPADERPGGDEALIGWLDQWWKRIDDWIDSEQEPDGA